MYLRNGGFAELDRGEAKRLEQCVRVLAKISEGKTVGDVLLQSALTEEEFAKYRQSYSLAVAHTEHEWDERRPSDLTHYIKLVARADFYNAMADRCSRAKTKKYYKDGQSSAQRMRYKAVHMYERALEYLRELFENSMSVQGVEHWLDRDVSWKQGEEPGTDAVSIPRVRGSRSDYALQSNIPIWNAKRGKFWRQREALSQAALTLLYEEPEEAVLTDEQREKLRKLRSALSASKLHPEQD